MSDIDKQKLRELCERKHAVETAGYWFRSAREAQRDGKLSEALLFMENAYNHTESALIAARARIDELETQSRGVDEAMVEDALAVPAQQWQPTQAARDVLAERQRHIEEKSWTARHDDAHVDGSIAIAAACYAAFEKLERSDHYRRSMRVIFQPEIIRDVPTLWPWHYKWWKPGNRRRNLVKAGALILAEIERLDRLPAPPAQEQE